MSVRVNGATWCSGISAGMLHSFEDRIAFVSLLPYSELFSWRVWWLRVALAARERRRL
jgi:hypothetical protein